ncbi:MAG: DUF4153 domain-containing protein [Pseudomonadota bacterium]
MSTADAERPTRALLWVSLLQGACLYHLYGATKAERWPSTVPVWDYPLWTLAVISPLMLLLSVTRDNWKSVSRDVAVFSFLLALLAIYVGIQATPFSAFPIGGLAGVYSATAFIASFKAVIHIQRRAEGYGLSSYPSLFTNSWRSFLIGAFAGAFALLFWLILTLWGALFDAIGVGFFSKLFREDWFAVPTLTLAFGIGVLLFRSNTRVIDSITQLLHSLFKLLLPLIVALASVFLIALPFTGLEPLWNTGNGTALLLWLLALMLFCVNAVYQDGRQADPYSRALHRGIFLGVCTSPIISALAFYGLFLRLQEYGWTVERCWAFVTWLLLSLFAAGYVIGVIRRRDAWTEDLARTNTAMSLVVLAIMLLANSPVLDFRKISLASQINRVASGNIELADFDFWYTQQNLARPGYLYTEKLKEEIGDDNPELLAAIEQPTRRGIRRPDRELLWANMRYRPEDLDIPPPLRRTITESVYQVTSEPSVLLAQDLDADGSDEYVLLQLWSGNNGLMRAQVFFQQGEGWRSDELMVQSNLGRAFTGEGDDLLGRLLDSPIELREKRFKDLDIGGVRLSVNLARWD